MYVNAECMASLRFSLPVWRERAPNPTRVNVFGLNRYCFSYIIKTNRYSSLRWRHNGRDSVSKHQPHHCLLNRLFRCRSKKTSKLRVTGLCVGNSPGTGEFPAQMASNAENVSIWWRHHFVINKFSQHKLRLGLRTIQPSNAGKIVLFPNLVSPKLTCYAMIKDLRF